MNDYIYGDFLLRNKVDAVLLAGHWRANDLPRLAGTLSWLQQRKIPVVLFGPSYEFKLPVPRLIAMATRESAPRRNFNQFLTPDSKPLDGIMKQMAVGYPNVRYVSLIDDLCQPSACPAYTLDGGPMMFDAQHFTTQGSMEVARAIKDRHQLP